MSGWSFEYSANTRFSERYEVDERNKTLYPRTTYNLNPYLLHRARY